MSMKPIVVVKLLRKKECWVPTRLGWLALCILVGMSAFASVRLICPFLSPVHPVHGEILVAEGWLPDYALYQSLQIFNQQDYKFLVTTGIPVDKGYYLQKYKTFAQIGAATLVQFGADTNRLATVAAPDVVKDRTLTSARALKKWLEQNKPSVKAIDVCSQGAHSRRTRLIYTQVFGSEVTVGIIALPDSSYGCNSWWKSSSGFRTIVDESVAYLYARLHFYE